MRDRAAGWRTLLPGGLALLLLTACTPEPAGPCASALEGAARVELGGLSGGAYAPLRPGDELMVHAGLEWGFHSELAVRLWGEGADAARPGGLTIAADLDAPWDEAVTVDLSPVCHDLEEPALLHTMRFFYSGPGCGADPCSGPDDPSEACAAYTDCLDREELGIPNLEWEDLIGLTAGFEVVVEEGAFEASAGVAPIDLVRGFQVSGGG